MSTMNLEDDEIRFKRLSLDETLHRTVSYYCKGIKVFSQIAMLFVGLEACCWAIVLFFLQIALDFDGKRFSEPEYLASHIGTFYGILSIFMLVRVLVGALSNGAMIRAVLDLYMKKEPSVKECLKVGAMRAPTMLMASFLSLIAAVMGYILLYLPGLYLSIRLFVFAPAIIVEGLGPIQSLKRSSELVSGSWWYVFCTFFISYIFMILVQWAWTYLILGGDSIGAMFSISKSFLGAIPAVAFVPVYANMMTIMYLNLRVEKEGLNAHMLARDMGASGAVDASYSALLSEDDEAATTQDVV